MKGTVACGSDVVRSDSKVLVSNLSLSGVSSMNLAMTLTSQGLNCFICKRGSRDTDTDPANSSEHQLCLKTGYLSFESSRPTAGDRQGNTYLEKVYKECGGKCNIK